MPFNLGNFIVDAQGKFQNLSKGAFDAFGMAHGGEYDPGFGTLLKVSFADGVKRILGKAGFSKEQVETFGTTDFVQTLKNVAKGVESEAISAAVGAAGGAVGGPLGMALGFAVEAGQVIQKLAHPPHGFFDPNVGYRQGEWIVIDNGMKIMTTKMRNVLDKEFSEDRRRRLVLGGELSGEQPDVQQAEGIGVADSLSVGFFLAPGDESESVEVFNLLTCRDETKLRTEIKPLDENHAGQMDKNPVWSEIRLLRMVENQNEAGEYLDSEVSTDPGAEVFKNGVPFQVVSSDGTSIIIESEGGAVHKVDISELTPGRRNHTRTHNYSQSPAIEGGFSSGEKAPLAVGDFIWVDPSPHIANQHVHIKRMLACISYFMEDYVCYFYALDGMKQLEVLHQATHLRPVSDKFAEDLLAGYFFQLFKEAAVRGRDVERVAAGKRPELTLACLGVTAGGLTDEKPNWREEKNIRQRSAFEKVLADTQAEYDSFEKMAGIQDYSAPPFMDNKTMAVIPEEGVGEVFIPQGMWGFLDNIAQAGDGGERERLDEDAELFREGGLNPAPYGGTGLGTGPGVQPGDSPSMIKLRKVLRANMDAVDELFVSDPFTARDYDNIRQQLTLMGNVESVGIAQQRVKLGYLKMGQSVYDAAFSKVKVGPRRGVGSAVAISSQPEEQQKPTPRFPPTTPGDIPPLTVEDDGSVYLIVGGVVGVGVLIYFMSR